VTKGILNVSGREGTVTPQVADARMTVDAEAIDVTLSPRTLVARGDVRSVLKAGRDTAVKKASLLSSDEVAFVTAKTLTYDESTGLGVYSGQARLWQGETTVRAETVTLDDKRGDLTATGDVVSTLPLGGAPNEKTSSKPSIGRGAEFTYDDEKRSALYSKDAQLNGPEGNLSGDRIELTLAVDQNALASMVATGKVRLIVDKRDVTGASLTYDPRESSYIIGGTPARYLEECRETTGKTLTFFRSSDRIIVDGNQETRTHTRGGGQCPE
jgi:lipopolysaccharide export system protein LptA